MLAVGAGACSDEPADPSLEGAALDIPPSETLNDEADDLCCPVATAPSCDCFQVGGSVADGCHAICDAIPTGWELTTDDNGCEVWVGGAAGSCLGGY